MKTTDCYPKVPKGWRPLRKGEEIAAGDQAPYEGHWRAVEKSIGVQVDGFPEFDFFIRRKSTAKRGKMKPIDTSSQKR